MLPLVSGAPRRRLAAITTMMLASASALPALAQSAGWNNYASGASVQLDTSRYWGADGQISIRAGFNGNASTQTFTMDTGSTGILIGNSTYQGIKSANDVVLQSNVSFVYSSSGRTYTGSFILTNVDLRTAAGGSVTARVPIFVANTESDGSTTNTNPTPFMMGVGFDREKNGGNSVVSHNPLLNLAPSGTTPTGTTSTPHGGYAITTAGVFVGLGPSTTSGATMVKLTPGTVANPDSGFGPATFNEWTAPSFNLTVPAAAGGTMTASTQVLPDSGINYMIISPPDANGIVTGTAISGQVGKPAAAGTIVTLTIPGAGGALLSYTYTVGANGTVILPSDIVANLLPSNMNVVHDTTNGQTFVFVNTGLSFLNQFNYFFDYDNGLVGYASNGATGSFGTSTSALSLQGGLGLADGFTFPSPVYLAAASSLISAGASTLSGVVGGPGSLTIGGGAITLSAVNTYTGGTTVTGGATLSIAQDANLGAIVGALTLAGGTLQTTAALTSARAITLGTGGGIVQTLADTTLTSVISGAGGLTKTGTATLFLNGANTYTGGTTVRQGRLSVNGAIAGNVTVAQGAALGGNGTIQGNVVNAGTVSPGNSIGHLTINGGYTQTKDGTLTIEVDGARHDQLTVTGGKAKIDGTLAVSIKPGTKLRSTAFATIDGQAIEGAFSQVIDDNVHVTTGHKIVGNTVLLTFDRDFTTAAATANQTAVGRALNAGYREGVDQGDMDTLFTALDTLPSNAAAQSAYDSLSGSALSDLATSAVLQRGVAARGIEARLDQRRAGMGAVMAGTGVVQVASLSGSPGLLANQMALSGGAGGDTAATSPLWSAWARGVGTWGQLGGTGEAGGFHQSSGGAQIGLDRAFGDGLVGGFSLGYTGTNLGFANGQASSNATQLALYGSAALGSWFVDGQLGYTYSSWTTGRLIQVGGLARGASASPSGNDVTLSTRAGTRVNVAGLTVEPSIGLDWVHVERSSFSESGAGAAGLNVAGQTLDAVLPNLGVRVSAHYDVAGVAVAPELRARWYHDFGDGKSAMTATLQGDPAASFTVNGAYPGRDIGVIGAGVAAKASDSLSLFVAYDIQLASRLTNNVVSAGLKLKW